MRTPEQRERSRQAYMRRRINPVVDPTLEEIDAEREAIQAGWTDVERRRRYKMARSIESIDEADDVGQWTAPTARFSSPDELCMTDWSFG